MKTEKYSKNHGIALSLGSFFGEQCNMNLNPILQFYLVFSARVPDCLCDAEHGGNLETDDYDNASKCDHLLNKGAGFN